MVDSHNFLPGLTEDDLASQMPAPAAPGEKSVRDTSVEVSPGVYVTKMRVIPVALGRQALENRRRAIVARDVNVQQTEGLNEA